MDDQRLQAIRLVFVVVVALGLEVLPFIAAQERAAGDVGGKVSIRAGAVHDDARRLRFARGDGRQDHATKSNLICLGQFTGGTSDENAGCIELARRQHLDRSLELAFEVGRFHRIAEHAAGSLIEACCR